VTDQRGPTQSGAGDTKDGRGGERGRAVPDATVGRLAVYLRVVTMLGERGAATVSSDELAAASGVNPAKLRKDLSFLGSYGTRGVGYDVHLLTDEISRVLGVTRHRKVVLVGVGNLGRALAGYDGFASQGFTIAALFDADTDRIGEQIGGLVVQDMSGLAVACRVANVTIGMIATPAAAGQEVCDQLIAAGVTCILNFAPVVLSVPDGVDVRKVDLAGELQILSFHERRRSAGLEEVG
jgi:redox-sensing transcriptional repressor